MRLEKKRPGEHIKPNDKVREEKKKKKKNRRINVS